jgi:acetyl-CoA synthetase
MKKPARVGEGLIEGLLSTRERVPPPESVRAWASIPDQDAWNAEALRDPLAFWREQGTKVEWATAPACVLEGPLEAARWFHDGRLNATVSCLDRHAASHPDRVAYHYLCEDGTDRQMTFRELLAETNRLANALRADGVSSGDRVCIYMPLSLEGIVAMLACARIGAVHSVVYAGLGATALRDRIDDAGAEVVIGADVTLRRGRTIDLKKILDDAVAQSERVRRVVVWRRAEHPTPLGERERDFGDYVAAHAETCDPEIVEAEHPLFILYTSGTTGKPKGVVMTHGGYLVGASGMLAAPTRLRAEDV